MKRLFYRIAADTIVIAHTAYAAFVVLGLCLILIGIACKWHWIRNFKFRVIHLAMIGIVVAESLCGVVCPLTTWEKNLRRLSGQMSYDGDFLANWMHELLFYDFSPWVFTLLYSLFGLAVLATFILAPPRFPPWRRKPD